MLSIMHFLDAEEKEMLTAQMEPLLFKEDEVIIREGGLNATLFKIDHGVVRVIRRVEGKELILDDLHEGDAFGELTFLEGGPSSAECKALSHTRVLAMHRKEFDKICESHPQIGARVWLAMALNLKERLLKTNDLLASYFNISQSMMENEQFRKFYAYCFQ
jgi:CRP/FNR family transcriptional regulator, cyclic AMP receptor protein